MQTIIIVDDDLAFIFWLGLGLEEAGLQAVPAKNATAARALLGQLEGPVRVAIINPGLPGAVRLIKEMRRRFAGVKVLAAPAGESAPALPDADSTLRKPEELNETARSEWIDQIRQLAGAEASRRAT